MESTDETLRGPLEGAKTIRGAPREDLGESPREVRGSKVGRYVVLDELGSGGMGVVYSAYDPSLDRRVALKLLHPREARKASHRDRMLAEARALARLDAPNVVPIHDVGLADDRPFLAMEYVEGKTLLKWYAEQEPTWQEAIAVFLEAGEGLAAAHAVGLVHRDFKPENVIISDDGRVRVLDFGLAVQDFSHSSGTGSGTDHRDRRASSTVGTPAYMAPEQFAGLVVDHRSDQFSFCVALWETIYGERPFTGADITALATSVVSGRIKPPSKAAAGVPAELEKILRRGLAKEPSDRYATIRDLLAELRRLVTPRSSWKLPAAIGGAVVVTGAAVGVVALTGKDKGPCAGSERRLDGVWDRATRGSVEEAVKRHETLLGPQTWAALAEILDGYAGQWVEQHRAACVATHVDHEQSEEVWALRVACLNGRLESLRSVVDLVSEGEFSVVASAVATAEGLPPLETCENIEQLQHHTPPPSPQDAARVEGIDARLVRVKALREAARYEEAVELARRALDDAREVGYEPTIAAAHYELGKALMYIEKYEAVYRELVDAFFAARRGGDESTAARTALSLAETTGSRMQRLVEAAQWVRHAELALHAAGDPPRLHAKYLQGVAELRRDEGRFREAAELHREALDEMTTVEEPDSLTLVSARTKYARVLAELGRFDESLAIFEQDIETLRGRLGDNHPRVADLLVGRGDTLLRLSRQEEARKEFKKALEIYERSFGGDHGRVAATWTLLANTYPEESPEAIDLLERAYKQQKRTLPEYDTDIAYTAANLGSRLARTGRPQEGLARIEEAWKIFEKAYGPDHPIVGATRHNLGVALFNERRVDEALTHMDAALRIDRARLDPSHPTLISALSNVGLLYYTRERYSEAVPLLKEALALRATHPNPQEFDRSFNLTMALAAAYRKLDRLDDAAATVSTAVAMAEKLDDPWKRIQTEGERAEQMWERGEREAALDHATAVRRRIDPADAPENDDTVESLDAAIARWRRELGR